MEYLLESYGRRKKIFICVDSLSGSLPVTILDGGELGRCRWFSACETVCLRGLAGSGHGGQAGCGAGAGAARVGRQGALLCKTNWVKFHIAYIIEASTL